jgi:hypothetical protein
MGPSPGGEPSQRGSRIGGPLKRARWLWPSVPPAGGEGEARPPRSGGSRRPLRVDIPDSTPPGEGVSWSEDGFPPSCVVVASVTAERRQGARPGGRRPGARPGNGVLPWYWKRLRGAGAGGVRNDLGSGVIGEQVRSPGCCVLPRRPAASPERDAGGVRKRGVDSGVRERRRRGARHTFVFCVPPLRSGPQCDRLSLPSQRLLRPLFSPSPASHRTGF